MQVGAYAAGFASGVLSLAALMASGAASVPATPPVVSVCEISKDLPGFRDKPRDRTRRLLLRASAGVPPEMRWPFVALGRLRTRARRSSLGPCDRKSWGLTGYGHLDAFPAQIDADTFRHIEVKENPQSPYDYGNMYHGPA